MLPLKPVNASYLESRGLRPRGWGSWFSFGDDGGAYLIHPPLSGPKPLYDYISVAIIAK